MNLPLKKNAYYVNVYFYIENIWIRIHLKSWSFEFDRWGEYSY